MKKALDLILCIAALACALNTSAENLQVSFNPYDGPLPYFSTPVTHEEVRIAYYRYSVVSIVKKLHENKAANWNMIMGKVAQGDPEWIQYSAIYIAPGTDAGATTDYIVSLAHALPNNPQAVLALEEGAGRSLLPVCSLPFIEPAYDFITDYGKKTLSALKAVKEAHLQESRDTCMRRLQHSLEMAEQRHAEGKWQW